MMKVTTCFMSKGSLSRVRAMFDSVMAKNSSRVVLIALLMLCGRGSVFAQIKDGDIVTICYEATDRNGNVTSTNYLYANGTSISDKTTYDESCLWKITISGTNYSFQNVKTPTYNLYTYKGNGNTYNLTLGNTASSFVFNGSNVDNVAQGTLSYKYSNNSTRYIRFSNNNFQMSNTNNSNSLTIEKWTRVETTGSVVCTPSPLSHTFTGFIEDAVSSENATITIKVEREAPKAYYQNMNNTTQKIDITSSGSTEVTQPTIDRASAIWVSSNNSTSSATCAVYGEETKNHSLLSVGAPTAKGNNTWEFPISTIGKSPMEMTTDDGKWADYSDMIRFAFHDQETDATYYANVTVARYSFHEEDLPNFVVSTEPSSVAFTKGGGNKSLKITLTHQHGKLVRHMHGNISDNTSDYTKEVDVTREELTDLSFATFSAKKLTDETASEWLTVGTIAADGTLPLSAPANNTGGMRTARLVGLFNYTNPLDPSDQHYEYIEMQVTQNAKDGNWKLIPSKGHSGDNFVKNPYTNSDQQQVHTVEKTIYYTPNQAEIELRLTETAFRGYMRWYDYQTGCNPVYNADENQRTTWQTAPRYGTTNFTEINTTNGDSYGLYAVANNKGNITNPNTPRLIGWADGQPHIMACDVSSHKDYNVDNTNQTITEPTLSYRQLFHLRPAAEMADKFKAAAQKTEGSQFLENYEYTAPSGQTVMLSTQFRYKSFTKPRNSHSSEFCYYYYKNGTSGELGQVGVTADVTAKWYKVNGATLTEVENPTYPTFDYLQIAGQAANTEAEYQLIVSGVHGGKDLKIARFVVKFVDIDTHGPVNSIMTQADIAARYQILEYNDFSFGAAAPGTGNMTHLYKHLPWEESTYGYFYPTNVADECDRQNTDIPYYGEYALINYYSKSWAGGAQHGGADKGYALFVDGTTEPGLVASISTDAVICSGQTLYCSVWLMNPRKNNQGGTPPVFRCNIQGRHKGDAEWKDVGVYYVGAWDNYDQNWKQVVFPIQSRVSYDETRVSVYNFGTGGDGNDFFLDDLCLFVSPLPLAAYQATMGCRSYTDNATTSTAVVVRLDYAELNEGLQGKFAYYQLFNVTDNRVVKLKTINASDEIVSAYYAEDAANEAYGSVRIPAKDYTPGDDPDAGDVIATDGLQTYIEGLIDNNIRHGKCYVEDAVNDKWFLYVIHIVPNTQQNVSATDGDIYLAKDKEYLLRIAHAPGELGSAACASTTELHATTDTYVELRDDQDGVERVDCKNMLCANNHYFLDVKVQNTLAPSVGGALETVEALVHADWLVGAAFDDLYCDARSMTDEQKTAANTAFESEYKCERGDLRQAISDMRQVPSASKPNPNYQQADPTKLTTTADFDATELALIQRLCAEGKLKLYQTTSMFYMGSEEVVRYWIYPVAEDAKVTFNGQEYKLYDCDEPLWIKLTSQHSEYAVNLSPIDIANQKPNERLMLPSIRILEGTEQVVIPVKQLLGEAGLHSTLSPTKEEIVFNYKETIEKVLEYVDLSNNRIDIVGAPTTLEPGKDYLMRMAFYDQDGHAYIGGDERNCRVGFVYFYLSIVPKVVQWTGDASAVWGDDANWKARKADGTLMDVGFAPLPETNVIISTLPADKPYPIVMTDDYYPMDVNDLPNACNDIYFAPGAMIHNQHLLQYNRAFVDMTITPATWNSMAPPLKGMYTGDMYVPHSGNWSSGTNLEFEDTEDNSQYPFVVNSFKGARTSSAAYAFWQSIYNKRVPTYHENGNQSYPAVTEDVKFVETNSLGHPLPPGTGYQVLGYGPENIGGDIIVRLPKPDTYYSYYYSNGTPSDQGVSVTHSPKLAFEPDANGDMYITLTNALASNQFMFGNPAMANIDMAKFLEDNKSVLAKKYSVMNNSTWEAYAEASPLGELAPMRSALLELASGTATSVTVKLSKSHFVGYTEPAPASLPARRNSVTEESDESMLMTIYATNAGGQARCMVAAKGSASDIYESQEDVLFFSSGVEQGGDGSTATSPVNMYTVSKQVPMMVDVRENIDTVPVSMLVHDSYRTEKVTFAFYLSLNWNKECYFCDAVTGERYRIMDGLWLELDMPDNHETRYYITGPDRTTNDDVTTSTTQPAVPQVDNNALWAYSSTKGELVVSSTDIIKEIRVYDLAGHLIAHEALSLWNSTVALSVPTGMCIVEATMRDNSKHYTQTLVR